MTDKPNVLEIIARHRDSHHSMSISDAYSAGQYPLLRDAYDRIAELIAAANRVQELDKDGALTDNDMNALRAALAACAEAGHG